MLKNHFFLVFSNDQSIAPCDKNNPNLEECMKNALFVLASSILSLSLFAQEPQKSLYYYRKAKISLENKTEIRAFIHKHIFIPLLESSLSEDGLVQVHSLKISDFPRLRPKAYTIAFPLAIKLAIKEREYDVVCTIYLTNTSLGYEHITATSCFGKDGSLRFPQDVILHKGVIHNSVTDENDLPQAIIEITQTTSTCKVVITHQQQEKCLNYADEVISRFAIHLH